MSITKKKKQRLMSEFWRQRGEQVPGKFPRAVPQLAHRDTGTRALSKHIKKQPGRRGLLKMFATRRKFCWTTSKSR